MAKKSAVTRAAAASAKVVTWNKTLIEECKQAVRQELASFSAEEADSRLRYIFKKIQESEKDGGPKGQLRLYVLLMSALVHHERFGGLSSAQVKRFASYSFALLQTQGIVPGQSRIAFLYSELHLVLSQIYRKAGDHFQAFWEQQLALQCEGRDATQQEGINALSTAIRALRLGMGPLADLYYNVTMQSSLPDATHVRAQLGHLLCLRLKGDHARAVALAELIREEKKINESQQKEVDWEKLCRDVSASGDLGEMVSVVGRSGTHYAGIYVVECYFWAQAVAKREWRERLPLVKTLARNRTLKPQELGFFFDCALTLERCYDTEYPFPLRLRMMGEVLKDTHKLISIDKELLVWAASARWLARQHAFTLASFSLDQYQTLSLKLSGGQNSDALGIMGDLMAKSWFSPVPDTSSSSEPHQSDLDP